MASQEKLRRMAEKKRWDKLKEQFRGSREERMAAAQVCALSGDKDAYNLLVSEINSCTDSLEKIALIKILANTKRGEAAVYLSWLASTPVDADVKAAIEETLSAIRANFR